MAQASIFSAANRRIVPSHRRRGRQRPTDLSKHHFLIGTPEELVARMELPPGGNCQGGLPPENGDAQLPFRLGAYVKNQPETFFIFLVVIDARCQNKKPWLGARMFSAPVKRNGP
jgi:hypothetical protein